jgi:hypothetical protein
MATKLEKPVSREVLIKDEFGNENMLVVTISVSGVELRKKGTSRKLATDWTSLNKLFKLPPNAPSKFVANPLGWLTQE